MRDTLFVLLTLFSITITAAAPTSAAYYTFLLDLSGWGDTATYTIDYTTIQGTPTAWNGWEYFQMPAQYQGGTAQITSSGLEYTYQYSQTSLLVPTTGILYLPPVAISNAEAGLDPLQVTINISSVQGTVIYGAYVVDPVNGKSATLKVNDVSSPGSVTIDYSQIASSINRYVSPGQYDPLIVFPIVAISYQGSVTITSVSYVVHEDISDRIASIACLLATKGLKQYTTGALNSYDLSPGLGWDPAPLADVLSSGLVNGCIHKGFGNPRLIPPINLIKDWLLVSVTMDKYYAQQYGVSISSALACMGPIFPQLFEALKWAGIKFLLVLPSVEHGGKTTVVDPSEFGAPSTGTITISTTGISLSQAMLEPALVNGVYTLFPVSLSLFYNGAQPVTEPEVSTALSSFISQVPSNGVVIFYIPAEAVDSTSEYPFAYYDMIVTLEALLGISTITYTTLQNIFSQLSTGQLQPAYTATLESPVDPQPDYLNDWLSELYNALNESGIESLLSDINDQLQIIFQNGWFYTPNVPDDGQPFLSGPFQDVIYNGSPPFTPPTNPPLLDPDQYVDAWLEMLAWVYALPFRTFVDDVASGDTTSELTDAQKVVPYLEYLGYKLHQITAENGSDTTAQAINQVTSKVVEVEREQAAWARLVTDLLAMLLNMVGMLIVGWMILGV